MCESRAMPKKRSVSVKSVKGNSKSKSAFSRLEEKLDLILSNQTKMIAQESKIVANELQIEKLEADELRNDEKIGAQEREELAELKKIEALENELKDDIEKSSPLKKITYKDITKGIIGAFFGIVGHFAFVEGTHLSEEFSVLRCTVMYLTSFLILVAFLYFSGFRKITDEVKYKFLPLRAFVIYASAISTAYLVLLLFDSIHFGTPFIDVYRTISSISVLAVLGAATADLIGKNEDE